MFAGWQMMDGVHGDYTIKCVRLERQVGDITHHKEAVVANPLAGLTQRLNRNVKADTLLIAL